MKCSVFHLFQVVSVPFALLRTFGGVSNCAITGFGGYLIIVASTWFCKTAAVGNYQLLVESLNSFCHAILQLHNAANQNMPTAFTGAGVCLTLAVLTCCTLGGSKKRGKMVISLEKFYKVTYFSKLLGAESLEY